MVLLPLPLPLLLLLLVCLPWLVVVSSLLVQLMLYLLLLLLSSHMILTGCGCWQILSGSLQSRSLVRRVGETAALHVLVLAYNQSLTMICFSSLSLGVVRWVAASSGGGGICIQLYCRLSTGIPYFVACSTNWFLRVSKQSRQTAAMSPFSIVIVPLAGLCCLRNGKSTTRNARILLR